MPHRAKFRNHDFRYLKTLGDDAMELHPKYDRAPISNPEMYE